MKQNCWQFTGCGREPGGANARKQGVCPAATDATLDGIHGGAMGGRACWVVAGTLCGAPPAGSQAKQHETCKACGFYRNVRDEEFPDFLLVGPLRTLRGKK